MVISFIRGGGVDHYVIVIVSVMEWWDHYVIVIAFIRGVRGGPICNGHILYKGGGGEPLCDSHSLCKGVVGPLCDSHSLYGGGVGP